MRDFLLRVHISGSLAWLSELYRRWAKLGGAIALAFLSFAGINLIFGSREAAQATSVQSFGIDGYKDQANLSFDFQFIGQGRITGGSDDRWMIGNVPILVGEHTQLVNELHPGDFVTLSGRILQNEAWLADRIEISPAAESFFTFNGPLDWVRGDAWRIGGYSLVINPQTKFGVDPRVNDVLLTTFTVLKNGTWLALEIKAFDKLLNESPPIITDPPPPTSEIQASTPRLTLEVNANCRYGPGTGHDVVTSYLIGQEADIEGRNTDSTWWWILMPGASGAHCWISDATANITGDTSSLPVIEAQPPVDKNPEDTNDQVKHKNGRGRSDENKNDGKGKGKGKGGD